MFLMRLIFNGIYNIPHFFGNESANREKQAIRIFGPDGFGGCLFLLEEAGATQGK